MDGSTVRSGLSNELDHTSADRAEHLRRVAEVCKILNDQGIIVICSFISPKESIRQQLAEIINNTTNYQQQTTDSSGKNTRFHLIYMDADLEFCKTHKPDFYKKVETNKLENVPGIDEVYEKPLKAQFVFNPDQEDENIEKIINYLERNKIFPIK